MSAPPLHPELQDIIDRCDKARDNTMKIRYILGLAVDQPPIMDDDGLPKYEAFYFGSSILFVDLVRAIKEYQTYIAKMERDHAETISEMFHNKLNQES